MPFLIATSDQSKSTAWNTSNNTEQTIDATNESALATKIVIDLSINYPNRQITGFQLGTFIAQRCPGLVKFNSRMKSAQDAQQIGQMLINQGVITKLGGTESVGAVLESNSKRDAVKPVLRFKVKASSWYLITFTIKRACNGVALIKTILNEASMSEKSKASLNQDLQLLEKFLKVAQNSGAEISISKTMLHSFSIKYTPQGNPKCHICRKNVTSTTIVV